MQMNTLAIEAKFTILATTIKSLPNIAHKPAKTTLSIHVVYQLSNSFTCLYIIERVSIKIILCSGVVYHSIYSQAFSVNAIPTWRYEQGLCSLILSLLYQQTSVISYVAPHVTVIYKYNAIK